MDQKLTKLMSRQSPAVTPTVNWMTHSMLTRSYLGDDAINLEGEAPTIPDEVRAVMRAARGAGGPDAPKAKAFLKKQKLKKLKWDAAEKRTMKALIESTRDCSRAQQIAIIATDEKVTAREVWKRFCVNFSDNSEINLVNNIATFNRLAAKPGETRMEFIERISDSLILLASMQHKVSEHQKLERLLNGLISIPEYKTEAMILNMSKEKTWESAIEFCRQWDRRDAASNAVSSESAHVASSGEPCGGKYCSECQTESAHVAMTDLICHACGKKGHIATNCKDKTHQHGNPTKSQRRFQERKAAVKNKRDAANRGERTATENTMCFICKKLGHYAGHCPLADKFSDFLANNPRKKSKPTAESDDDDDMAYDQVIVGNDEKKDPKFASHICALDSGCTHHVLREDAVPPDTTRKTTGTKLLAANKKEINVLGAADVGHLKNSLIVPSDSTLMNLVSVATLDRSGCEIRFQHGVGTVTDANGSIIATGLLSDKSNLYEMDIRDVIKDLQTQTLDEKADHEEESSDDEELKSLAQALKSAQIDQDTALEEIRVRFQEETAPEGDEEKAPAHDHADPPPTLVSDSSSDDDSDEEPDVAYVCVIMDDKEENEMHTTEVGAPDVTGITVTEVMHATEIDAPDVAEATVTEVTHAMEVGAPDVTRVTVTEVTQQTEVDAPEVMDVTPAAAEANMYIGQTEVAAIVIAPADTVTFEGKAKTNVVDRLAQAAGGNLVADGITEQENEISETPLTSLNMRDDLKRRLQSRARGRMKAQKTKEIESQARHETKMQKMQKTRELQSQARDRMRETLKEAEKEALEEAQEEPPENDGDVPPLMDYRALVRADISSDPASRITVKMRNEAGSVKYVIRMNDILEPGDAAEIMEAKHRDLECQERSGNLPSTDKAKIAANRHKFCRDVEASDKREITRNLQAETWEVQSYSPDEPLAIATLTHSIKNDNMKSTLRVQEVDEIRDGEEFDAEAIDASMTSIRVLLTIAAHLNLVTDKLNFEKAYEEERLTRTVLAKPPTGLKELLRALPPMDEVTQDRMEHQLEGLENGRCLHMLKTVAGLKHPDITDLEKLTVHLQDLGLTANAADRCLFHKNIEQTYVDEPEEIVILAMDVTNHQFLIAASTNELKDEYVARIKSLIPLTSITPLTNFMNIDIKFMNNKTVQLNQEKIITEIVHKYDLERHCYPGNLGLTP